MTNSAYTYLRGLADTMHASGDPSTGFWYLGGPMTGLPQFNFPEFNRVAAKLRAADLNIISPAELDDTHATEVAMASEDGLDVKATGYDWHDYLARDLVICSMPTCLGGIFLPGWTNSNGAKLETFVLSQLKKELLSYSDQPGHGYSLLPFDRETELARTTA